MRKTFLLLLFSLCLVFTTQAQWTVLDGTATPKDDPIEFSFSNGHNLTEAEFDALWSTDGNIMSYTLFPDFVTYPDDGQRGMYKYTFSGTPNKGTFVFNIKSKDPDADWTFDIDLDFGTYREQIYLINDGTIRFAQGTNITPGHDPSDDYVDLPSGVSLNDWHVFRITFDATVPIVQIYVDEAPNPFGISTPKSGSSNNYFRFTHGDRKKSVSFDLNYLAWDESGAYAPGEGTALTPKEFSIAFLVAGDRDARQQEFLEAQGFNVNTIESIKLTEDTDSVVIDQLNAADLVIIGRSPNSGSYRGADAEIWQQITTPVILNAQYIATAGNARINWFESSSAYHANTEPVMAYASVADANDPIFSFVDFTDSIPWCYAPHDFLAVNDTATNGNIAAKWQDAAVLIVQNEGGSPLYENGPTPAGPRTYFGFGNDATGWDNFFPLTDEAQQVYFNEICRLLNIPMQEVVPVERTLEAANVILVKVDERDQRQQEFLEAQGYNVTTVESIALTTDTDSTLLINQLNAADLVIIGRSPNSGQYRGADAEIWQQITTPVILNAQYIATAGNARINWFESSSAYHANTEPVMAYASVADPNDPIFSFVDFTDSIPWCYAPHDFLAVNDTATNGNIAAKWQDAAVLIVQNEGSTPLYENGPTPAGPRTYFGFGNDATGWDNFFPLTKEAQQVYFNEIQRLLGRQMKKVVPVEETLKPANVILVKVEDRDQRQQEFLEAQGYNVTTIESIALTTDTDSTLLINQLNAADLVIIGRSPNSGQYRGADAEIWQQITAPVILNAQYIATAGNARINWFEASSAFHENEGPAVAYAKVANPSDPIYSFVTVDGDSIPWCYPPHDFLAVDDTATNGNVAARWNNAVLIVQNESGTPLYDGGPTPAGARTYFGFGNDAEGWDNFFPLTVEAQQVYFNEIQRLLGRNMKAVVTVEPTTKVLVTGITVAGAGGATTVNIDATLQMEATVTPDDATDKTITWSVAAGTGTATINATGLLTGETAGTVTVTATNDASGVYGTAEITVNPAGTITPTSVTISGDKAVEVGKSITLTAVVAPTGASQDVEWSSSDDTKATVDATGKVTGVANGSVTITATAKGTTVKGTYDITVGTTSISSFASAELSYYPNPTNGMLYISNAGSVNYIEILDISGKLEMTVNTASAEFELNVTQLKSGMYIMRAYTNDNVYVTKFMKK